MTHPLFDGSGVSHVPAVFKVLGATNQNSVLPQLYPKSVIRSRQPVSQSSGGAYPVSALLSRYQTDFEELEYLGKGRWMYLIFEFCLMNTFLFTLNDD